MLCVNCGLKPGFIRRKSWHRLCSCILAVRCVGCARRERWVDGHPQALRRCGVVWLQLKGCRRCDDQCDECTTHGTRCSVCKWYRTVEHECADDCSLVYPPSYLQPLDVPLTEQGLCLPCHVECRQCSAPTHVDCERCENRKIYVKDLLQHSGNDEELLLTNYSVTVNDTVCPVLHRSCSNSRNTSWVDSELQWCGGNFNDHFVANFVPSMSV